MQLVNMDATIVAQKPKLAPHIDSMRRILRRILKWMRHCVSVKATTSEGLGFEGRLEGISAKAIVLVTKMQADAGTVYPGTYSVDPESCLR
ncbi:MAG: 2-C-methyl-D-erythritol 2,4-cyclodiphosphate synthase [Balneolaceae bacterium]|nr:2-C-methyl-D-erythritol 2,4-cyclodiphosphate synthase [Balneolaceae bacterium]